MYLLDRLLSCAFIFNTPFTAIVSPFTADLAFLSLSCDSDTTPAMILSYLFVFGEITLYHGV